MQVPSSIYCTSSRGGTTRELWRVIQELSPFTSWVWILQTIKKGIKLGFPAWETDANAPQLSQLACIVHKPVPKCPWIMIIFKAWLLQYQCQLCSHLVGTSEHTCVSESAILKTQACWKASAITISLLHFYKPSLKAYWKKQWFNYVNKLLAEYYDVKS